MNDKELLEAAAKAAGIDGAWGKEGFIEQNEGFIPTGYRRRWDPIERSDDAFYLAVVLRMMIEIGTETITAAGETGDVEYVHYGKQGTAPDAATATRLAIVRVAAQIGSKA